MYKRAPWQKKANLGIQRLAVKFFTGTQFSFFLSFFFQCMEL